MDRDAFESIASMIMENVRHKWTSSRKSKWIESFLTECSQLPLPTFIQITNERVHSSIVIASEMAGVHYRDILLSPDFSPAVFYVYDLNHFDYCQIGKSPISFFV